MDFLQIYGTLENSKNTFNEVTNFSTCLNFSFQTESAIVMIYEHGEYRDMRATRQDKQRRNVINEVPPMEGWQSREHMHPVSLASQLEEKLS